MLMQRPSLRAKSGELTIQDLRSLRPGLMITDHGDKGEDDGEDNEDGVKEVGIGGYYGAPNTICDSPWALTEATFDWIEDNIKDTIDFVVWTGDNARHDSDNTHPRTQDQINEMNNAVAKRVLAAFPATSGPNGDARIPIVPSIGNNDVYPHNVMYPGPSPPLNHFAEIWSEFIPHDQQELFRQGGYYAKEVIPGKVTVFALNTLYFYIHNVVVDGCKKRNQPGTQQMDWLERELKSLRERGMVAYLTGHVPPEVKSYSKSCHLKYTRLALEYQDVIVGHLYGHANIDHFFLLSQNKKGKDERIMESEQDRDYADHEENTEDYDNDNDENGDSADDDDDDDDDDEEDDNDDRVDVLDEEDYDPFHMMGLSSYLDDLWAQYDGVHKKVKHNRYAIVQVSPSVIPSYHPTLRVFTYELSDNNSSTGIAAEDTEKQASEERRIEGQMTDQDLENYFSAQLNNDVDLVHTLRQQYQQQQQQQRHKKKKHPINTIPAPVTTFGYPLSYTQYWTNLTLANQAPNPVLTPPVYEVEYETRQDYGMQHLGASEYLILARRIAKEKKLKKEYLKRMVVQTGAESRLHLDMKDDD
ncbi:Endopolyphosphatase [Mortierella claussenii]|nr:Endopolyphosphatase [Mortierella claussenii]